MATPSPIKKPMEPLPENLLNTPEPASLPLSPAINSETPMTDTKEITTPTIFRPPESPPPEQTSIITMPSYSRWFSLSKIHQSEERYLPEFFDGKSSSKNPNVYKYYRDSIIRIYRQNPSRKITFTEVRKAIIGDVGSIRRVFDFLEGWGLINYTGMVTKAVAKGEDKENNKSGGGDLRGSLNDGSGKKIENPRKFCSGCKSVCSIACFVCDKFDLTLCARCYVRGNYRVGVNSSDFRRVEISEETRTGWTDKETLHLLEAVMHFGEDWKKVSEHVGGRTERECVARFVKLPFGEQFADHQDSDEVNKYYHTNNHGNVETEEEDVHSSPAKRRRLTPFSDASNPIMAQAAFLSAMVGSEVAEAAAKAAVAALSEVDLSVDPGCREGNDEAPADETQQKGLASDEEAASPVSNDASMNTLKAAVVEAEALIEKEEQELEQSISDIVEVQMREIQDKVVKFEEVELQMEKEREQLQHMKSLLFADQLALVNQGTSGASKDGENTGGIRSTNSVVL